MKFKNIGIGISLTTFVIVLLLMVYFINNFQNGVATVNKEWRATKLNKISDFGSTKTLSILPLVNWNTSDDKFKGEAGVSYLIKTDQQTLLFDFGFNANNETPSPLQHNMNQLGIKIEDIDTLFLSHHHLDHSGGQQWVNKNTFSLGTEQISLVDKKIYSPIELSYPDVEVITIPKPSVIGQGIASTGAIPRQLLMGRVEEQALVINVEGKGLVVIVGCGHQTLPKILQRTTHVFNEPIYGLVGDLHYPVPEGRLNLLGINLQRVFASGDGPHRPIDQKTISNEIELLKNLTPSLVALGSHDTSDQVIDDFSQDFGKNYRYVRVGEWITLSE